MGIDGMNSADIFDEYFDDEKPKYIIKNSEIENMYENAGVKPEYRYDCNLADTIKPIEVFPLRSCSKGEIKDYCTNKQDYRYCKVYKVNKIYPPFTAEKQLELIKSILVSSTDRNIDLCKQDKFYRFTVIHIGTDKVFEGIDKDFSVALARLINQLWQDLTEEERRQIKEVLE